MVDLNSISVALASLKASKDIAEAMIGVRDAAVFNARQLELQSKIMDAQASIFAVNNERMELLKRINDLEKEVSDFKTWESDKQKYELRNTSQFGGAAYGLKNELRAADKPHYYLCANCFQNNKKRFLQPTQNKLSGRPVFECSECQSRVPVEW